MFVAAWTDPAFRDRLKAEPLATLHEMGFSLTNGMKMQVVENTRETFFVVLPAPPWVVPTHLTLFPYIDDDVPASQRNLADLHVGLWYDRELRERVLSDPADALAERGVAIPDGAAVEVLENTAQKMYLALPEPPDIANLSQQEIAAAAEGAVVGVLLSKIY